ncbi:predicted protein [Pyrenophora tritici-repentis Pt-1C-BFP]|uniref:Uncharacterized protein n=1 Tax=Pyrenophora tritici-repentis (strain Pt-1C-BFP) TaxID=426418 RepID=B2VXS4_PYRTR|nr:uncharacterized protein PTRG_03320 [Pyrenophora tritici-repentis Pt-1C-BFP]EDU45843.1 predicted protein [Pyrenophora tritici-repentis Pt-1C-BFP]
MLPVCRDYANATEAKTVCHASAFVTWSLRRGPKGLAGAGGYSNWFAGDFAPA